MLPEQVCPYTGPYFGPSDARGPMKGPTALALKHAMVRSGRMSKFPAKDDPQARVYGEKLESAISRFQEDWNLYPSGQYGHGTWQALRRARVPAGRVHAGEYLLDAFALDLIQSDPALKTPKERVQEAMAEYLTASEKAKAKIHYAQFRPMTHLGRNPASGFTADCSGFVTSAYYSAGAPDPNGDRYSGYGYTGTLVQHNLSRSTVAPYETGDVAIYGPSLSRTAHTAICLKPGSASSAVWISHGNELGPYAVKLHYRLDLLNVYRPKLLS